MDRAAAELFRELDCAISPAAAVRNLRIGDQQLVEIAKALSLRSRILIMDEPTSALTESEAARLFRVIGRLREARRHHAVHLAQDGRGLPAGRHDHRPAGRLRRENAAPRGNFAAGNHAAHGRPGNRRRREFAPPLNSAGEEILRVENLSLPWRGHPRQWRLENISFALHRGEILGVAGLMGAGRTELLECLSALRRNRRAEASPTKAGR